MKSSDHFSVQIVLCVYRDGVEKRCLFMDVICRSQEVNRSDLSFLVNLEVIRA